MAHLVSFLSLLAGAALIFAPLALGAPSTPPAREHIRHEDPATVAEDSDPAALFEWYLDAARLMSSWRFREGRLSVLRLNLASLPPEVRSLVGDINRLLVKEGSILEATDGWLRDAARLLAAGRREDAQRVLAQMGGYLRRGEILFDDLAGGIEDLARRTGIRELPPENPQRRAYEDLLRVAARVRALLVASRAAVAEPSTTAAVAGLLPFVTRLEIADPGPAYPGRRVVIRGHAVEQAPVPSRRRVRLSLDGFPIGDFPLGPFSVSLTLSPNLLPGPQAITAHVPAQGRYLGAEAQRTLTVLRLAPNVRLEAPAYGVAPGRLALTGRATSALGRVERGKVTARVGRASQETSTDQEGGFSLGLSMPATLDLVGPEILAVDVRPREPWHAEAAATSRVFIINLTNLGLAALLLPLAGVVYALRRRMTPSRREKLPLSPAAAVPARSGPPQAAVLRVKGAVARVYVEAVGLIEQAAGIAMESSMTMREFLQRSQAILRSSAFEELTLLTERAVYAAPGAGEEALRAEELLERIKGDVAHGLH